MNATASKCYNGGTMAGQTLLIVNSIVLVAISLLLAYDIYTLRALRNLRTLFLEEQHPQNLEEILLSIGKKLRLTDKKLLGQKEYAERLEALLGFALQKSAVVKFNSLADQGGNLSFVIALLDIHDSGFVLTSMHGREQNRIYTKLIQGGRSEGALTEEEQQAVHQAMTSWKKQIQHK